MTVQASTGIFGFGCQTAKGALATTWYRHKASRVNMGPIQVVNQFPDEVGGGFHPTGAYKAMAAGGGAAVMNPRLESVFGWLLYGACGRLSNTYSSQPEAGIYRHNFAPPAAPSDMKWMSARRYIPGADATDEIGEILLDARLAGLRFAIAPASLIGATVSFVARVPYLAEDIDSGGANEWTWANAYEDYTSVPLSNQADLTIGTGTPPATALTVDIVNMYTTPEEELIVGSPYPDDFVLRKQVMSFEWVYKWQDHDLYQALVTGDNVTASNKIAWSAVPHSGAFDFSVTSPGNISGLSNPYRLRIYAPSVVWQAAGAPELIGGGWLQMPFSGVAQESSSPATFLISLDNEESTYSWPS